MSKASNSVVAGVARLLCSLVLVTAGGVAAAERAPGDAVEIQRSPVTPSPLWAIDQHRVTVVDRIVGVWGETLVKANAGIDAEQLRSLLMAMRADQLLAAPDNSGPSALRAGSRTTSRT